MSSSNLKIPSPWSQLALLTILAGCAVILVGVFYGGHTGQTPSDVLTQKLIQMAASIILFGMPALLYALVTFRKAPLQELGFRPTEKSIFYLLPVVLLAVSLPLEGWLGMINKQLPLPHWMVDMEQGKDKQIALLLSGKRPIDMVINVIVMAVVPAFMEEACFRGSLQRVMINLFRSPWAGIVFTGLWFSASHGEFEGFLPRACLGILLGAAYWYSRSLWPVIIAHACFNGVQVIAAAYYPSMVTENPSVHFYWALLSFVLVVGLLAYMRRSSTVTYAQIYR
jgi:hypothetical protein